MRRLSWLAGVFAVALALILSCARAPAPSVEPRMRAHFQDADRLYTAVTTGDLHAVQDAAHELLARETGEGMPRKARSYVEELRTFTDLAARAPDVPSAARAVARVGAACGSCHKMMRRGPAYAALAIPHEGATPVAARMTRHQWAAERLWDALVGPSDTSWRAGAAVLRDAPLFTDELTQDLAQYEAVTKLAWTVHDIGARATSVHGNTERADLYADLLATCARCHDLLRQNR